MKLPALLLTLFYLVVLTACSDEPPAKKSASKKSNPLSHQMDALNKAKNLEGEMNKALQDRLKAIDGQK